MGRIVALGTALLLVFGGLQAAADESVSSLDRQGLIAAAEASRSDALYVTVGDQVVIDWRPEGQHPQPYELMSAVKSVVALAIGRLLSLGHLESLDQPVHGFFPEWKQGRKQQITVRHLLNHTSGLQNVPSAGAEIYPSPDAVRLALAAELDHAPGEHFSYNNKAVNLLAGIVERASGQRMDLFIQKQLFALLGIKTYQWYFDASGSPHAMAGLRLYAADVAKLGRLVLDRGQWQGEALLAADFVDQMLAPGQEHYPLAGLLWWRHAGSQEIELAATADLETLPWLAAFAGKTFSSWGEVRELLPQAMGSPEKARRWLGNHGRAALREHFDWRLGEIDAYYGEGYLGQYLVVVPAADLVAVRQIDSKPGLDRDTEFRDFVKQVVRFASAMPTAD
ncbi:MAG: serine hydrolase domain-containing protein [Acidobacteriota bacterium]